MNKTDKKVLKKFCKDFWFAPCDIILRATEERIFRNLDFQRPILDIGTGDGRNTKALFWNRIKLEMGLDPNEKAVKNARKIGIYKKVTIGDAAKMPFKARSFATVVSNSTFEHITDDETSIKEVARVLKKGGKFYLTTTSDRLARTVKKLYGNKKEFEKYNDRVDHLHYRSLSDWEKIFKKNKLKIVEKKYYLSNKQIKIWYWFHRLVTFKPYKRELWSYLKDSPYGKLFPSGLISKLLFLFFSYTREDLFQKKGNWVYIVAEKQ